MDWKNQIYILNVEYCPDRKSYVLKLRILFGLHGVEGGWLLGVAF